MEATYWVFAAMIFKMPLIHLLWSHLCATRRVYYLGIVCSSRYGCQRMSIFQPCAQATSSKFLDVETLQVNPEVNPALHHHIMSVDIQQTTFVKQLAANGNLNLSTKRKYC